MIISNYLIKMTGKRPVFSTRRFCGQPSPLDNTEPPTLRQIIQYSYFLRNSYPGLKIFDISKKIAKDVTAIWQTVNPRLPLYACYYIAKMVKSACLKASKANRKSLSIVKKQNLEKRLDKIFDICVSTCKLPVRSRHGSAVMCNNTEDCRGPPRIKTEPLTPDYPNKSKVTTKPVFETLSSADCLIQHDPLSQPTTANLQIKQERQFGNEFFDERRQMAPTQSTLMAAQPLPPRTQMQVQQHLQVNSLLSAPTQPVLAPPVVVAKPKPLEKPRPRKKRIFVIADHQRCVMSNLTSLWKSGKLCDAGIGNGSSTVRVHKVILSAVCPKLLSVFSADFFSQKFLQVNFPESVSKEALKAFAEYMYRGVLNLDRDILEQLKIIAKRLDMKEFEQLCDSHLPNHMHHPASTAASYTSVPLIQTTMQMPAMTSSHASIGPNVSTSMQSPSSSITTQVIDVKQEISDAELAQVRKDTAAMFGRQSEVALLAPNKSGNAAGFVISPSIKMELVGPEDEKYGHWYGGSSNQAFTSTTSTSSSSSITATASTTVESIPTSSTKFAIPFPETTNVKSTRLKATHSYEAPLVSDLYPVSGIVETLRSQSNHMNVDSSKTLNRPSVSTLSINGQLTSTSNEGVYPVSLFTAGGDTLPLLTTPTVDINTIDLYETDVT